jgi:hypothetical protein
MNINGFAYTENEKEISVKRNNRFKELTIILKDKFVVDTNEHNYNRNNYTGRINKDMINKISAEDIALLMDGGFNLPFGGISNIDNDGHFFVTVYTD